MGDLLRLEPGMLRGPFILVDRVPRTKSWAVVCRWCGRRLTIHTSNLLRVSTCGRCVGGGGGKTVFPIQWRDVGGVRDVGGGEEGESIVRVRCRKCDLQWELKIDNIFGGEGRLCDLVSCQVCG